MQPLPIDPLLPAIAASLRDHRNLVLTAEPGAGKTTRVPASLKLDRDEPRQVVVLEPRRLAARVSAARVADERKERLGGAVGYQVRFDQRATAATGLLFVTEGILLRRLLSEPTLPRVGTVVLDEFHERSLQADLLLAFLRRLQRGARPDLSLVVMSATLDAEPVRDYLGDCPAVHAPGRLFPVEILHQHDFDARPLEEQVSAAVRAELGRGDGGDLLVFLPGMAEIRRAAARLEGLGDVEVLPLHGSLPPEAQDRAIRPAGHRKVILSTNVAETSLTIDGVTAVIDSGLARISGHSAWSGLPTLKVMKVSRASATQRAGRAGRTRPGRAVRLYTQADFDGRRAHELPEIRRADLSEAVLLLHALGISDLASFEWLEAPEPAGLLAADELLTRLGAIQKSALTEMGRNLSRLPLPPRLGRVLVEADARGAGREGAKLVALLQEGDLRDLGVPDQTHDADVLAALERFRNAGPSVQRSASQLEGYLGSLGGTEGVRAAPEARSPTGGPGVLAKPTPRAEKDIPTALRLSLLAGYPDRVARRRRPGNPELLLSGGGTALLSKQSVVRDAQWLVAIEAEEQRRPGEAILGAIRSASAIDPDWLIDLFPDQVREERRVRFDADAERVDVDSRILYGALVLDESRAQATPAELGEALATAALERGPPAYAPEGEPARTLSRLRFARVAAPRLELPDLGAADVERTVHQLAHGRRRFSELREAGVVEALLADLTHVQHQGFESAAPDAVTLPSGRRARVEYEDGKPPWIESRLQDFFGWKESPALGNTRLTLHLLAPNKRAVQVTNDLSGFWTRHYPQIRRELMRRYPRHAWPEDPTRPLPPRPPRSGGGPGSRR